MAVAKSGKEEDLVSVGNVVGRRFVVTRKIKSGGFGQVYEAKDRKHRNAAVALKVEDRNLTPVLGHEVDVMIKMRGLKHVAKMFHCGQEGTRLNFIAMQLLGKNLSDLRRQSPDKHAARFSWGTASRVTVEFLDAILTLHQNGYIHRDIKASNFAIGCTAATRRTIYMIDYGMARQHIMDDGSVVPQRPKVFFRGTIRYASIAAHMLQDLGRKDDLISLFYTVAEAFHGRLPWRNLREKKTVLAMKLKSNPKAVCHDAPPEVLAMGSYVSSLKYADEPNYEMLTQSFQALIKNLGVKPADPYDWECDWISFSAQSKTPSKKPSR